MDIEIRDKWISALRSGEYKQGHGYLREVKNNSFCCLGVLCDIIDPDNWSKGHQTYTFNKKSNGGNQYCGVLLPPSVREMTGLPETEEDTLIVMNDDQLLSFNQIADWIEANL